MTSSFLTYRPRPGHVLVKSGCVHPAILSPKMTVENTPHPTGAAAPHEALSPESKERRPALTSALHTAHCLQGPAAGVGVAGRPPCRPIFLLSSPSTARFSTHRPCPPISRDQGNLFRRTADSWGGGPLCGADGRTAGLARFPVPFFPLFCPSSPAPHCPPLCPPQFSGGHSRTPLLLLQVRLPTACLKQVPSTAAR